MIWAPAARRSFTAWMKASEVGKPDEFRVDEKARAAPGAQS